MSQGRVDDFSLPWCRALLESRLWNDVDFGWDLSTEVRVDLNEFWTNTLSNERGLRASYALVKSKTNTNASDPDVMMLLSLGPGLAGIQGVQHGGATSTILDMITGFSINVIDQTRFITTAKLSIEYKAPVPVPSVALAKAWITKRDGRKIYVRGTVEDGEGTIFASAEALYIKLETHASSAKL